MSLAAALALSLVLVSGAWGSQICSGNFYNPTIASVAACSDITGTLTFSLSSSLTAIDLPALQNVTQQLIVSDNFILSLLEFDTLRFAGSLEISSNNVLQTVILAQLTRVDGDFIVRDNFNLVSVFAPDLAFVQGVFIIQGSSLATLKLPSLVSVFGSGNADIVGFGVVNNPALTSLVFPEFTSFMLGALQICQNNDSFSIPSAFQTIWSGHQCSVADGATQCPSELSPCSYPTTTSAPTNCVPTAQTACIFHSASNLLDCSGLSMPLPPCTLPAGAFSLDLSSNSISAIEVGMFSGSGYSELVNISLSFNPIASIQGNSFLVTELLMLVDLQSLTVETVIESGAFAGLNKHSVVDLSSTTVSTVASNAFGSLLTYLCGSEQTCQPNACGNTCGGGSECYVFGVLSPATSFTCVGTCIPAHLTGCTVQSGSVYSCQNLGMTLVPCTIPAHNPTVSILMLNQNKITYIGPELFIGSGYSNIGSFTFDSNPIAIIAQNSFRNGPTSISFNSLSVPVVISPFAFAGDPDIEFYNTPIANYAANSFGSVTQFMCGTSGSQYCHPNKCSDACGANLCIVNAVLFPDTKLVCATNCNANALSQCFVDDDDEGGIDCSSQALTQLPCALPSPTTSLNYDYNLITSIPQGVFQNAGFSTLQILSLRFNNIVSLSLLGLSSLSFLDVSNNKLAATQSIAVSGASQLHTLVLSNNPITFAAPNVFASISPALDALLFENILNVTLGPLAFQGLPESALVSTLGTSVFTLASFAFPTSISEFECGQTVAQNCSTLACESQCGSNSLCIVEGFLTPTTHFTCSD